MSTDRRGDALHLERALARYLIERRMSRRQVLGHMATLGAAAAVGSVAAACTVKDYINNHNQNPQVFIWTAPVEQILTKVAKSKEVLDALH